MDEIRLKAYGRERKTLSASAAFAEASKGRRRPEPECPIRTCFQRDRDRIIHSSSFRRLKHKTQVFLSPEGDYYRTRLTHTLEVSQIARTISGALDLNGDLTEAIALGHDLGHTPFGHAGERALDSAVPGGFRHYEQSLRTVDMLEKNGEGLNLTFEVRDGILRHAGETPAATLEGEVVRLADRIAYINHDIDDATTAGVMREEDIPSAIRDELGRSKSERINTLVTSCVENGGDKVRLGDGVSQAFDELRVFMFEKVYTNPACKGEEGKAADMIKRLYYHFLENTDDLPEQFRLIAERDGASAAARDYVAGMTDRYAVGTFNELYVPKGWREIDAMFIRKLR